jgi:hypothetical protein
LRASERERETLKESGRRLNGVHNPSSITFKKKYKVGRQEVKKKVVADGRGGRKRFLLTSEYQLDEDESKAGC